MFMAKLSMASLINHFDLGRICIQEMDDITGGLFTHRNDPVGHPAGMLHFLVVHHHIKP